MSRQDASDMSPPDPRHAKAWAEAYELIDLQLSPLGLATMQALSPGPGETVVDIGCGTGQSLLQLAEHVGPARLVIGVDVAPMLLDVASGRTRSLGQIHLMQADAQVVDLPSASADGFFSRFGVMGFRDPIAAFSNFRRILKPAGRLAFCCWRSLQENQLDHFPMAAAEIELPVDSTPFSFADANRIRHVLTRAGFREIDVRPHDENVSSGDLEAMTSVLLQIGALGKLVRDNPPLRVASEPRLRTALAALGDPASVHLTASVWIVTAIR